MRPRVFPAEDPARAAARAPARRCFNEAAGIPRGRRHRDRGRWQPQCASMRPRVFPAEDLIDGDVDNRSLAASMRPRVFPAEDVVRR